MTSDQNSADHAWIHDHLAAALTGGLTPDEQAQFDAHIHSCPACFDAFTEARDADRFIQRALDGLTPPPPGDHFEDRLITALREKEMKYRFHPLAKRAGFAIAAAVALAATGVFGQYVVHTNLLNNPMSERLAAAQGTMSLSGLVNQFVPHRKLIESVSGGERNAVVDRDADMEGEAAAPRITLYDNRLGQLGGKDGNRYTGGTAAPFDIARRSRSKVSDAPVAAGASSSGFGSTSGAGGRLNEAAKIRNGMVGNDQQHGSFGVNAIVDAGTTASLSGRREAAGEKYNLKNDLLVDADQQLYYRAGDSAATGGKLDLERSAANAPYFKAKDDKAQGFQMKLAEASSASSPTGAPVPVPLPDLVAAAPSTAPPAPTTPPATEIAERKIIRNGNVEFEVRSFDDAFATISSVVGEEGGFVSSTSSDKLANGKVRGSISVRVPPEHLDRLLLKLRALGELKSQQIGANDITKEYTDLESELRALRAMESRLIDIIKTANGQVKDLVVAEKQLGEYRIRIEKIEGEIRYYNNLVGMATLTITAYEKDIQTPTAAQEQENISLNLETEDVESRYTEARKVIEEAKGRVIESELKKHDAGQYAAQIVAEVPPDKADFVAAQLKQLGTIAAFNRDRKQTTTGGNGAPTVQVEQKLTRFSLSIYNLANIAPRETSVLTIAVRDVEGAFKSVLATVQKTPDDGKLRDVQPKPIGRVITSNLTGQQPDQMTAEIRADVTSADADNVLQSLRALGEVMASSISENPDTANVTAAKRGVQIRLVNVASVPARESRSLSTVAAQVPDAYAKLIATLQTLESAGSAHILTSQLNQTDPRTVNATLAFDVRRDALPAVDKGFTDAGIDILSRNVARSTDTANTLDTKVHFQIDELKSADALPPQRSTTLGIEGDNVEKGMQSLRAQLDRDGITHIQYSIGKEASGRVTGHLIADVPLSDSMKLLSEIHDLGGDEKVNQVVDDPQVPPTRFAKARIDLTLSSRESIVGNDRGLGSTMRAALGSAAAALLWSLYLIISGILFVGPWLLIAWAGWKLARRRRTA